VNVLPQNLTHLCFGKEYKQEISENVLPLSLKYLSFRDCLNFDHEFKINVLPKNLTHLCVSYYYNGQIMNIPDSVTHMYFWNCNENMVFPTSLNTLYFNGYNNLLNLPNTLEEIIFFSLKVPFDNLPFFVKKVVMVNITEGNIKFVKKIPHGCKIVNFDNKEIKEIELNSNHV